MASESSEHRSVRRRIQFAVSWVVMLALALLLHLRLSRRLSFKDSVSGESLGFAPPSNEKQSKGLTEYMKRRNRLVLWNDWITDRNEVVDDADANGPVLDFVIAGFPKCGTTTMEANLGGLAPMPISDVCTPLPQTIWYAFRNWPNQFPDKDGGNTTKLLRGTKCPAAIHALKPYSRKLPRTLVIIGIRHPILWFQSFWNMQAQNDPNKYGRITPYNMTAKCGKGCNQKGCPGRQLFCVARARFHVHLAKLGKTSLNESERALLAPHDNDSGNYVQSQKIRNPIFLYEQTELNEEDLWESLARLLHYPEPTIPHNKRHNSRGKVRNESFAVNTIDICDADYDRFRSIMMPYAYEMSKWVCDYFVASPDVHVANHKRFCSIVRNYANDPCGRLIRTEGGNYMIRDDIETNSTGNNQSQIAVM